MLKLGTIGYKVVTLVARLLELGFLEKPITTNTFTQLIEHAVIAFQQSVDLIPDGIVGPKTEHALAHGNNDTSKLLKQSDIIAAAQELKCSPAAVMAVNQVESRGHGFLDDGRPVILFERHIMHRRMLLNGVEANVVELAAHQWPDLVNTTPGGYVGMSGEHTRLEHAITIHRASALESCSWGQFQIMGMHWAHLGYDSIDSFVTEMSQSEATQLSAFVTFIQADRDLFNALQHHDWRTFARRYNGPAYAKNRYDTKLETAFKKYSQQHG